MDYYMDSEEQRSAAIGFEGETGLLIGRSRALHGRQAA